MLQGLPWNICWNAHGLTCVTFKPFSLYSIHCTCTYAPCSWQKIIISCAYREWFHGFRTPMKNSNLLNSLSKVIENNKQSEPPNPHPTPLFRFLGKIFIRVWMCLIFFQIWICLTFFRRLRFAVTMNTSYSWITEQNLLFSKTLRPWSDGGGGWELKPNISMLIFRWT